MNILALVAPGPASCGLPLAVNLDLGFLIPLGGMAFALGIILIATLEKAQKERLRHETIRHALEKGQPLPPELFEGKQVQKARDDRRGGLMAIAVGIALFVFLGSLHSEGVPDGVKWVGLIPGLVGVAMLINWALERGEKNGPDHS
jgi:hypothetical protein